MKTKYSREFVQERIQEFVNKTTVKPNDVFVVVMDGGYWLGSQLLNHYTDIALEVKFVKLKSYSENKRGEISIVYFPEMNLKGKNVIVVDDICDSGETLKKIDELLRESNPSSVQYITLLKRKGCDVEGLKLSSVIEDDSADFFVGCGMDDQDGLYRNIDYITVV